MLKTSQHGSKKGMPGVNLLLFRLKQMADECKRWVESRETRPMPVSEWQRMRKDFAQTAEEAQDWYDRLERAERRKVQAQSELKLATQALEEIYGESSSMFTRLGGRLYAWLGPDQVALGPFGVVVSRQGKRPKQRKHDGE
jgi:hypothetical protein